MFASQVQGKAAKSSQRRRSHFVFIKAATTGRRDVYLFIFNLLQVVGDEDVTAACQAQTHQSASTFRRCAESKPE